MSSFPPAAGLPFYKLTGSGNDFIFFDARTSGDGDQGRGVPRFDWTQLQTPAAIRALCDRRNGVGADGLVLLEAPAPGVVRIAYYNRDGSRASLCGNATLCTARLAVLLDAVPAGTDFEIATDAGAIPAHVPSAGRDPEIQLGAPRTVIPDVPDIRPAAGERRVGFAIAGVPHVVVLVDDAEVVDVADRGAALRVAAESRPDGANVNFVSPAGGRWRMRTFERGVEGETLACGTGAVASAALIARWTGTTDPVEIITSSGRVQRITLPTSADGRPTLAGEGRLVFRGVLPDAD